MPRNPVILAACLAPAVGVLPAVPRADAKGPAFGVEPRLPTPRPVRGFSLMRTLLGTLPATQPTHRVVSDFRFSGRDPDAPSQLATHDRVFAPALGTATGPGAPSHAPSAARMLSLAHVPRPADRNDAGLGATVAITGPDGREAGVSILPLHVSPMATEPQPPETWKA